jgi:hypothetical protein
MKAKLTPFIETAFVAIGEALVSLIVMLVFFLFGKFDYTVALGAVLGAGVITFNFLFLSLTTNKAVDDVMALRGDGEMDEEAAAEFAKEHAQRFQNAVRLSFIIRTFSMLAALVLAFLLSSVFNVIATVIPLLMLRPIIYVRELFRRKEDGKHES